MKFRIFASLFILMVIVLGISNGKVSANSDSGELIEVSQPEIEYYDENNQRIYPYSEEELNNMQNVDTFASSWKKYRFGKTTLTYSLWIGGGTTFYNPGSVIVESKSAFRNKLTVNAYEGTRLAGSARIGSGWVGDAAMSFTHLKRGKSYKFKLVNNTIGRPAYLDGGEVWYK